MHNLEKDDPEDDHRLKGVASEVRQLCNEFPVYLKKGMAHE